MNMTTQQAREKITKCAGGQPLFFVIATLSTQVCGNDIFMYEKYITANPRARIHCAQLGIELSDIEAEPITLEDAIVLIKTGAASLAPSKGEWLEVYSMEDVPAEPGKITGRVNSMMI